MRKSVWKWSKSISVPLLLLSLAIRKKLYGTESYARTIMDANGISDPRRLRVGQTLQIPAIARDGQ